MLQTQIAKISQEYNKNREKYKITNYVAKYKGCVLELHYWAVKQK